MTAALQEALKFVKRGFPVFPIFDVFDVAGAARCRCGKSDCLNPAKHPVAPLVRNGLRSATSDPRQVDTWWHSRTWNVGVVTGGKAVVLDVDPRHRGDESLAALEREHGILPDTWRAFTGGGGEHIFFAPPADVPIGNSANKVGEGLDIRGVGGYVVAPPSRHICGGFYDWNVDLHPDDVPLAPMPEWLALAATAASGLDSGGRIDLAGLASANVVEGGRNVTLTRFAGHLLRRYVDPHAVLELLVAWNATRCSPPLKENEVVKIVESIAARELKRRKAARQ